MSEFEKQLAERGFVVSRKCLNKDLLGLYIDDENKKWTITGSSLKKLRRFDYAQILDFELFEDGRSITSGKSGSALVGGLLAGGTGAIIGSSGKRETVQKVNKLQLRIVVDDLKTPAIYFDFPTAFMAKGNYTYQEAEQKAHEMMALLTYMMNKAKEAKTNI